MVVLGGAPEMHAAPESLHLKAFSSNSTVDICLRPYGDQLRMSKVPIYRMLLSRPEDPVSENSVQQG